MLRNISTVLFATLFSAGLFASGFQINEHGSRAMSMGGAFTGLADDPSAVYFNAAGITQLPGTNISLGATLIYPTSTFTGPDPQKTSSSLEKQFFTPVNFYFTQQLNEKLFIGLGFNNPFGLGTKWDENWVGRYNALETEVRTFNLSPVIAYKVTDNFSASFGLTLSYADVLITRKIAAAFTNPMNGTVIPLDDIHLKMTGDAISYGFNAGILYFPWKEFSIGASFKSQIRYEMEGDAELTLPKIPSILSAYESLILGRMAVGYPHGPINAPLTVPIVFTTGVAYRSPEGHKIVADFQFNAWESYDKLEIEFNEWKNPENGKNISTSTRKYKNSWIARIGGEYKALESFRVRGGVYFDKNPIRDERLDFTLPDADRIGMNIGAGYDVTDYMTVDASYLYIYFYDREINTSGEFIPISKIPLNGFYETRADLFSLNLSFKL